MIILFFLQYSQSENMSTAQIDIEKKNSEIYQADIQSIRNLSKLANDLTNNGKLVVPGGLEVVGPFNLLPKGTIVAFNGTIAPVGWAICDGKTVNEYKTPDLRGRFIRMHTSGINAAKYVDMNVKQDKENKGYSKTNRRTFMAQQNFKEYGGSDTVKLDIGQLPKHNHNMSAAGKHKHTVDSTYKAMYPSTTHNQAISVWKGKQRGYLNGAASKALNQISTVDSVSHTHQITKTGGDMGHNNTPPYYVLTWIVKVI